MGNVWCISSISNTRFYFWLGFKSIMNKIKNYLYSIAMKSPLRKWALSLTGWKWWFYQIVVCGIIFAVLEYLLNLIGLTMLPWR